MLRTYHRFFSVFFQLIDAAAVFLAWMLAFQIRFVWQPSFLPAAEPALFQDYLNFSLYLMVIWYISLQLSGVYKSWRIDRPIYEIWNITKATFLAFLITTTLVQFLARESYSRIALGIFLVFVLFFLILSRVLIRIALRYSRKRGYNQRHILIVGDIKMAESISERIQHRPELGLQIKSVVPPQSFEQVDSLVKEQNIDQVIVSLKNDQVHLLDGILSALIETQVQVRVIPDISQYAILGFEVEEFDGLPILTLNQSPIVGWNAVLKRITDIIYASLALILFSPLMITIAILIKLTSKGPILYTQERMGLDGKTFKMLKFRSMKVDAETQTGAVWAKKDDDRTTWIGKLIRKTSVDELPQLFNVLVGDMSCVGPRPERPVFVDKFRKEIPGYMLRHKVKAGMTGWAQINGLRGNTSLKDRIEYDLYYITHWSLGFDLKIMFMTIFKGFVSPHAY